MTTPTANFHSIADGVYAWQPQQRGWGLANCGLVASADTALWIDTPYDRTLAGEFLDRSRAVLAPGVTVDRIVVTHANGDHMWGAGVLPDAEIIATREALHHIAYEPTPEQQHALLNTLDPASDTGAYLHEHFGCFDWSDTPPVTPDTVFTGELELRVGDLPVQISSLPPAHTSGDLIVHLPTRSTVFTGDIVFGSTAERPGDHAVHWAGPLGNIVDAVERLLDTGAETVVPGHGPLLTRADLRAHAGYLRYLRDRAHALHAAGVPLADAARTVLDERRYPELGLPERLLVTLGTEYRHLDGAEPPAMLEVVGRMAGLARQRAAEGATSTV
ncbi:MBL fold metallo-hydrolase [Streptomyces sp. TLI_171]|uniref:MBL fold metallo-hydrolase n=1 Tax=Streptomyces sp. TLI_171 TaxID=1938859 RepID=UPI000C197416|nr:MBL fold metallo-hydrolase [Streptomyces sp. TLI_171]RKE21181.1 glyoxylase-like metal-dependent hydrolase (beta-lactamase superfamily II) [Streptomyces sp. TLI_171]